MCYPVLCGGRLLRSLRSVVRRLPPLSTFLPLVKVCGSFPNTTWATLFRVNLFQDLTRVRTKNRQSPEDCIDSGKSNLSSIHSRTMADIETPFA
jgi:hypothetical protein